VVLVFDAVQQGRERSTGLRQQVRLRPGELLQIRARHVEARREQGHADQQQPARHWQATPRNKIAGTYKADKWCNCPNNISATQSPEAGRDRRFPRLRQEHGEWTSPINNHVLFEAVGLHLFERWGNMHYRVHDGSLTDPAIESVLPQLYAVMEQGGPYAGLNYGILSNYNNTAVPSWTYRAAMSYVTGSHAFKYGFNRTHGYLDENQYTLNPVALRLGAGTVNGVALPSGRSQPGHRAPDVSRQDQPRQRSRLLRPGSLDAEPPDGAGGSALRLLRHQRPRTAPGPEAIAPTRNITFPAQDLISWKTSAIAPALPTTSSAPARRRSRWRSTSICLARR
jgi:hypothetical protein